MLIYQTARKLHLWLGLILAIILLIEAIIGLILAEPRLVGQEKNQMPPVRQSTSQAQQTSPGDKGLLTHGQEQVQANTKPVVSGVFGIAKGLHQGKIGNLNLKWIIDLAAIGLIILTLTGIYLSIPFLKTQRKK